MISKDSVPWRVLEMSLDKGALTDGQIEELVTRFSLSKDDLMRLSFGLAIALDPQRYLGREETKSAQATKGRRDVEAAAKLLDTAIKALLRAKAQIETVRFKSPIPHIAALSKNINDRRTLDTAITEATSYRRFLDAALRDNLITSSDVSDKRRLRDERRRIVCKFIFESWMESGRSLSYTTDPITSERVGPLVAFVNAIVPYVTDPPTQLNGEAIKVEIDEFRATQENRGVL